MTNRDRLHLFLARSKLAEFAAERTGTTAIEYALIGSLISIVILVALTAIGTSLNAKFMSGIVNGLN